VAAECEKALIAGGQCGVAAVGRCIDCHNAFCGSHQAVNSYTTFVDLCAGCHAKRAWNAKAPQRAAEAVAQNLSERMARAIATLVSSPPNGLVARRRLVTSERRFLLRVEWWDEFEPAWPIGSHPWHFSETHTSGDRDTAIPTGLTPTGKLVPLEQPSAAEPPARTTPDRPLPRFARLGQGSHSPVQLSPAESLPLVQALEALVQRSGLGDAAKD